MPETITQIDFSGGLNTSLEVASIGPTEYAFLRNGRTRELTIKPIRLPVELTSVGLPDEGNRQGLYALGQYLLAFIDGKAYVADLTAESFYFTLIEDFQMDPLVDRIYAAAIPASPSSFARTLIDAVSPNKEVNLTSPVSGHPAVIVCQDGINQPYGIFSNGVARRLSTYDEWSQENREYVPIGKQMAVSDNILFVVAPDGLTLLRSLRAKMLDFVINIDGNGNKAGDAYTSSHSVGFNTITAISRVQGNPEIKLMVCSATSTDILTVRNDRTFFGEYMFSNITVLPTGAKNQESVFADLGDMIVIDAIGVRSFNATQQILTESNNDVFSRNVSNLFVTGDDQPLAQDVTAIGSFSNYIHFAIKSVHGYGVLVYDINSSKFVSFDQYTGIEAISQFAEAKIGNDYRFFFLTDTGKIYEHYVGDPAPVTFVPKGLTTEDVKEQLIDCVFTAQFSNIATIGTVQATALLDRSAFYLGSRTVNVGTAVANDNKYPLNSGQNNGTFPVTNTSKGKKSAFSVTCRYTWTFDGELLSTSIEGNKYKADVSFAQKGSLLS